MTTPAQISVIVATPASASYLEDTIGSLFAQDYPDLQVIVEEEMGRSFGEALNRGVARANGDIVGCLAPGDILLPSALQGVANEVADAPRREGKKGVAVDHPAEYLGHFDHLAVWKHRFDRVPRSAVFWHRSVVERVGRFIAGPPHAAHYDFICRVGSAYPIRTVADTWSATIVHSRSADAAFTEAEMSLAWLDISRRYWGSWLAPLRWRCEASFRLHALNMHEHARHHARQAERAAANHERARSQLERLKTWLYSPAMARARFGVRYWRELQRKSP